jgi:hypothetical protein
MFICKFSNHKKHILAEFSHAWQFLSLTVLTAIKSAIFGEKKRHWNVDICNKMYVNQTKFGVYGHTQKNQVGKISTLVA